LPNLIVSDKEVPVRDEVCIIKCPSLNSGKKPSINFGTKNIPEEQISSAHIEEIFGNLDKKYKAFS
jgi:hypothetical protein